MVTLGWLACIAVLVGTALLAKNQPEGWYFRAAGDVLWLVWAILSPGSVSLAITCAVFICIDFSGLYMRRKEKQLIAAAALAKAKEKMN